MVCKENVVSWFGNLSSYKRIDVMCTLLNMCLPFEVRYLGTCVEDIGKRDYNDLRDTEHHANSASELAELTANSNVTDKRTRRKLALYTALLHSCNYACAVILYKNLSNLDHQEITNLLNGTSFNNMDDQPLEELLLLYTMALNHPAFTYEQKSVFGNIFIKLQEEEARLNLSKINSSFKPAQGCGPCMSTNERLMEPEIPSSCLMPPPPMQPYHGEMAMRNNAMVTGVPPGLTIPPPGLCLPGTPEQIPMGAGGTTQYVHLFPSMNHLPPWTVSRQSSPSQSRSPSRSNSPMGRGRTNANPRTSSTQVAQSTSNTMTTSSSATGSNSQTSISGSAATNNNNSNNNSLPPLPTLGASRSLPSQQPPLLPSSRSVPLSITSSSSSFSRHNSVDNNTPSSTLIPASQQKQAPPPPRLRSSNSGDSLRETLGKEMPNFKGNLQNLSRDEIGRLSDEDLRNIGFTPNAVGQLRSIVKSQTTNGLNQIPADKKLDNTSNTTHPVAESIENEVVPGMEVLGDSNNTSGKSMPLQEQHPAMHHHNHVATPNIRRYPAAVPSLDPAQIQMYPAPPQMYTAQNAPCYTCLTVPVAGMQNRFSRCNAQHVYCLAQLQALRLDSESSRHCSQSSSSDSTGSRSPPETPPAAPWVSADNNNVANEHVNSAPVHPTTTAPPPPPPHVAQPASQQTMQTSERQLARKNPQARATMRQKSQGMLNGNGNGGPPSLPHCPAVSFPAPHSQLTYLPHGHFPAAIRPSTTGIYSNFLHGPSAARPAYPGAYQPNGEMMYPYTGHPGASGGTPPPNAAAAATPVPASYMPPTPVVTYAAAVIPPAKISCYNCGSSNHLAVDCKDQTMEDLTKKAQYRLDYTIMKQPGECPSSDK
ncbi:PREDICTED: LOW QUALITY PROTEIN: zinc finger CCHC domain-containing protein 2 [Dinoponera quadriceps]|uniref:LOW QUALITY PROTEIN: zinc finger CCHC domain-containing protein 2 n=1 Tax=Dinoponera quadriceps TaxID=609295 RepID=A0A6P3XFS2_DINQU|nr:PREDICTED: LOW QUALITY PROTEIN: zinc finger CCHC domain-containing protein 2 [Dinoponera quadriceps]